MRDYRHAGRDLDRALAFTQARDLAGYTQHLLGNRARLRLDRGDWAGAEQDARAALAERVGSSGRLADALVPLALLQARRVVAEPYRLLLEGDWRAAADAWQERGCPYQQALALACGDQDEALLAALALLDGLGARQTAQRLRRQLRRRGNLRVPRGPTRATAAARARRRLFDPVGHYNRPDVFQLIVDDRPKPHLVSLAQAEPVMATPDPPGDG
jgi:hypothetical protein